MSGIMKCKQMSAFVIIGAIVMFLIFLTSALQFSDLNQDDFSNGIYNGTFYNVTGVVLYGNNLSGTYTSEIFDATSTARWNNLSSAKSLPELEYLFAVDGVADIWKSTDSGVNWSLVNDDYNGADGNGATYMVKNSSGSLFILYGQDLWASNNRGLSWTKINDDFNPGDSNSGLVIEITDNDNIFIVDGSEEVFKSTDSGFSFTSLAASFGGNVNAKGLTSNSLNQLFIVDGVADIWKSTDSGVNWSLVNDDYNGAGGNDATDMFSDSSDNLFILHNQDLWKSTDSGVNWSLVNDDYNGAGDSNSGIVMLIDSNDYIYIADSSEDIYKSTDSGVSFTWVATNINAASGNVFGLSYLISETNLTFQVKNCSQADCSDSTWQTINLDNINLTGRYFQYKAFFSSQDSSISPKLFNVSLGYDILDNIPPLFSNYVENPSAATYSSGQTYQFNVTVTEQNPGNVRIEFNGINYTDGSVINYSDVYSFGIDDLPAGSYSYRWWANDTLGNINSSGARYYMINKANGDDIVHLSTPSAGWNYNYGTSSIFGCSADYGTPKLYKDNVEIANPSTITLAAGTYNIKCNISESHNYTYGMAQGVLTVNKATGQTGLTFDKTSPQTYGHYVTPNCSMLNGFGIALLTLDGGTINSGEQINLGAGTRNFNCSNDGNENYTSASNYSQFLINKNITTTSVLTNPASPIDYGTESNFSCYNSANLNGNFYINGIEKNSEKGLNIIRAAGDYVLNCTTLGNENYTGSSEQMIYTINKTPGDIKLELNGLEANITIDYPEQYMVNASTLYGLFSIYMNGLEITGNNELLITPARNAALYNITAVSTGDENHSSVSITRWLNVTLDADIPELAIVSPQNGGVYGYNQSLELSFSVYDVHLNSCWYKLNDGDNIKIANCQNITFNASYDGEYVLYLYANDTLGNEAYLNSTFSVLVGAPTIILNSPIGVYLNTQEIIFKYTPSDLDLGSCELWGDFTGNFTLNQTNNNPLNYTENIFNLSLSDGDYKWNIKCNDIIGHSVFNGNKTFHVDTVKPTIDITEPKNTKISWTGIPLTFTINDSSPTYCKFSVGWATGGTVISNTSIANCLGTSFNLSSVGDYVLNLYVTDFAGNTNYSSSSFTVSTSGGGESPPPGGGGGGGGGGSFSNLSSLKKTNISNNNVEFINLGDVIISPGESKTIQLSLKNTGKTFLNKCKFVGKGEYKSWFDSPDIKNINIGEIADYMLKINAPLTSNQVDNPSIGLVCLEKTIDVPMKIIILQAGMSIDISNIELVSEYGLEINYSIVGNSAFSENLIFRVVDSEDNLIYEKIENVDVTNEKNEKSIILDVSGANKGLLKVIIAKKDGGESLIEEFFVYDSSSKGLSGFVLFENINRPLTYSLLIALIFIIAAFIILRRIIVLKKWKKHK